MATTFTLISTVTVGTATGTIDFTSIPATYTDLCLKTSLASSAGNPQVRFNSSSASIYSERLLYGNGTAAASASASAANKFEWVLNTSTSPIFASSEIYIPNYAGSANKSISSDNVQEANTTSVSAYLDAGLWSSTAAITSINIYLTTGNYVQYSTASLYGILKA